MSQACIIPPLAGLCSARASSLPEDSCCYCNGIVKSYLSGGCCFTVMRREKSRAHASTKKVNLWDQAASCNKAVSGLLHLIFPDTREREQPPLCCDILSSHRAGCQRQAWHRRTTSSRCQTSGVQGHSAGSVGSWWHPITILTVPWRNLFPGSREWLSLPHLECDWPLWGHLAVHLFYKPAPEYTNKHMEDAELQSLFSSVPPSGNGGLWFFSVFEHSSCRGKCEKVRNLRVTSLGLSPWGSPGCHRCEHHELVSTLPLHCTLLTQSECEGIWEHLKVNSGLPNLTWSWRCNYPT